MCLCTVYSDTLLSDYNFAVCLFNSGNGYIGMSMDGKHGVWLKGERGLDIATDYNPLMQFEVKNYDIKGKVVR